MLLNLVQSNKKANDIHEGKWNGLGGKFEAVALEPGAWVSAILGLARDEPLRQSLLRNAEVKSAVLANMAQQGYSGLFGGYSEKKT